MLRLAKLVLIVCVTSGITQCSGFSYESTPIRGVNLGGWLILEKWVSPSLFSGLPDTVVDEYTFCKHLGYTEAAKLLKNHWETWVTEADISALKNAGINHLRIPFGYWAIENPTGEPWVNGSWAYAMKAIGWAKKYGLQVMIDLHGLPGSQNGQDHSGRKGDIKFYYDDANLALATRVVSKVAQALTKADFKDTVTIFQVINEPNLWGSDYNFRLNRLRQYYNSAYKEVRKYTDTAYVAVHDAFIDLSNWYYFGNSSYSSVMVDTHYYQVFGDQYKDLPCDQQRDYPCKKKSALEEANKKVKVVVGEWSIATPNKCGIQSAFARNQIGVFETASSGWVMWSLKNGQGWAEWDFLASNAKGWIPKLGSTKITATC